MTCTDVQALCQPYLDGELDCAERCAIEHHAASCESCQALLARERAGHAALKNATCGCVRAPSRLSQRAFARLDAPCPVRSHKAAALGALAAVLICAAGGYAVYCQRECRWVVGAAETFDRIADGRAGGDSKELPKALAPGLSEALAPSLERCALKTQHSGPVQVAGCTGHFISYGEDEDKGTKATLLVLATEEFPRGVKLRGDMVGAEHRGHAVLAWRAPDKQHLCIFVTRRSVEEALPLAEIARTEIANSTLR